MKHEKDKEEGVMQKEREGAKKCENSVTWSRNTANAMFNSRKNTLGYVRGHSVCVVRVAAHQATNISE